MANVLDLTAAHPQREEHAADHQGHEDGLGGEAAPGAGPRDEARPYARMLTSVLESLVRRTDLTTKRPAKSASAAGGARREERSGRGDCGRKGICRRFQHEHRQGGAEVHRRPQCDRARTIDLEPIGTKAIAALQKKVAAPSYEKTERALRQRSFHALSSTIRHRAQPIEVVRGTSRHAAAVEFRRCDGDGAFDHRAVRATAKSIRSTLSTTSSSR